MSSRLQRQEYCEKFDVWNLAKSLETMALTAKLRPRLNRHSENIILDRVN